MTVDEICARITILQALETIGTFQSGYPSALQVLRINLKSLKFAIDISAVRCVLMLWSTCFAEVKMGDEAVQNRQCLYCIEERRLF